MARARVVRVVDTGAVATLTGEDFSDGPDDRFARVLRLLEPLDLRKDEHEISMIGVGPLENLFHDGFEDWLWPDIERHARSDPKFRRALASSWAYRSSRFNDRRDLLAELGEPTGSAHD